MESLWVVIAITTLCVYLRTKRTEKGVLNRRKSTYLIDKVHSAQETLKQTPIIWIVFFSPKLARPCTRSRVNKQYRSWLWTAREKVAFCILIACDQLLRLQRNKYTRIFFIFNKFYWCEKELDYPCFIYSCVFPKNNQQCRNVKIMFTRLNWLNKPNDMMVSLTYFQFLACDLKKMAVSKRII